MRVIRSPEALAIDEGEPAIFAAGSIDMGGAVDWQQQLADRLVPQPGVLLNPRRMRWEAGEAADASNAVFREQVAWELDAMEAASLIAFYFAPASQAPVTLLELGLAARTGKAVVCCREGYWRRGNVVAVCERYGVPMVDSLDALARAIQGFCEGVGVRRSRGLRTGRPSAARP
jgi:hypothetical protein